MRIGLVIPAFDPRCGGAEQWTWQFARLLLRRGEEVHVLASRFAPQAEELRIQRHALPALRSKWGFALAAAEALRRLRLDVVHDMGSGWHCDIFHPHGGSRRASFQQNLLLEPAWLRPLKRWGSCLLPRYREFERLTRRQYVADGRRFVALSRMVARHFIELHGVPASHIRIVYNGVDLERFSPALRDEHRERLRRKLGVAGDEMLVLIVAHNFVLKGVPALIAAVGALVQRGERVRLAVIGGKRLKPYMRLAENCGASLAAAFLGSIDDAAPYYAAADVYVQPTFYDPCSLVVLEALASGLPVITTRFNGASEIMTPGEEGFILDDPADVEQLIHLLSECLDEDRRCRMGLAARTLARQHSLERNCDEIVALYREQTNHRAAA